MFCDSKEDNTKNLFDLCCMFNAFVSTCTVAFCTGHGKNKTCRFDTGGFVIVSSLCGVVGLQS